MPSRVKANCPHRSAEPRPDEGVDAQSSHAGDPNIRALTRARRFRRPTVVLRDRPRGGRKCG